MERGGFTNSKFGDSLLFFIHFKMLYINILNIYKSL